MYWKDFQKSSFQKLSFDIFPKKSASLTFGSGESVQQAQVERTKAGQELLQGGMRSQNRQPVREKKTHKTHKHIHMTHLPVPVYG